VGPRISVTIRKFYSNLNNLEIYESSPKNHGEIDKLKIKCEGYIQNKYYPEKEAWATINGFKTEYLEFKIFSDSNLDFFIIQNGFKHIYIQTKF
jgi:hypothetical protein